MGGWCYHSVCYLIGVLISRYVLDLNTELVCYSDPQWKTNKHGIWMVQTFQIIERSFIQVIGCVTENLANKLRWVFKPWPEQQTIAGHLNSEQVKVYFSDVSLIQFPTDDSENSDEPNFWLILLCHVRNLPRQLFGNGSIYSKTAIPCNYIIAFLRIIFFTGIWHFPKLVGLSVSLGVVKD